MMPKPEVKRRNKVVVLRFYKREAYTPERRPSIKGFFRRIKTFFPCRAGEITVEELENLILETFGSDYRYHILLSDEKYRIITKGDMEELLKKDDTNTYTYVPTYFDCDDYADVLLGCLTKKTYPQGFALGETWWYCSEFGHAQNLFCDGEKIYIVEPQTDEITTWSDIKKKHPDAKAFMVKF